jgi:ROS/MUCR transcriptional regulator protein/Winged helix-turn-helix DNA-binding
VLAQELAYYRAHFREAVQKDGVICLECGSTFKYLPGHLCKHNLSSDEYKAKWGYNRTTPLERLITRRKKRRNALRMKFGSLAPPEAHEKALNARRGHGFPYRPERRLITTEAARAKVAASIRRAGQNARKVVGNGRTHRAVKTYRRGSRFKPSKSDLKILSLRKKGLWLGQIAHVAGMKVRSVEHRLRRLKLDGFSIPRPTTPRPNAHRKVTDDELLAAARLGLSIPEIAAKVGIAVTNVHKRIKRLMEGR